MRARAGSTQRATRPAWNMTAVQIAGSDEFYVYGGFRAKNREFIDAVKSGTQPASHFGDAVKTMEVAETILAAALLNEE